MAPSEDTAYQIDKTGIRRSFDQAAGNYEACAILQQMVEDRLVERLKLVRCKPSRILDLGCGPGRGSQLLLQKYRRARLIAADIAPGMLKLTRAKRRFFQALHPVCLDGEQLPFPEATFDLVFSNLTFQWAADLDQLFRELTRVLKPDGLLLFTTFGPDTLVELRQAWADVDDRVHVNRFIDMHDIGDALIRCGLESPVLDVENITLTYGKLAELARDLKAIGAHNLNQGRRPGLTSPRQWRRLERAYEAFRDANRLPATYEVVYAHAWKPSRPEIDSSPQEAIMRFHPRRR